jgi:hypothetical protein
MRQKKLQTGIKPFKNHGIRLGATGSPLNRRLREGKKSCDGALSTIG